MKCIKAFICLSIAFSFSVCMFANTTKDTVVKPRPSVNSKTAKPFKIITEGKKITVKSTKDIRKALAWTASGHRFSEQTNINTASCNFTVPNNERFIFVMLELEDGKVYTEKVGVQ